jgi:hypothetical protein
MDSNFWSAVSAMGQWAGAIATFAAVWVALRQVKEAKEVMKPKLNIAWELREKYNQEILTVTAVNLKSIPIHINLAHSFFWFKNMSKGLRVPKELIECEAPLLLSPGQMVQCNISLKELVELLYKSDFPLENPFRLSIVFLDSLSMPHDLDLDCKWIEDERRIGFEIYEIKNGHKGYRGPDNLVMIDKKSNSTIDN